MHLNINKPFFQTKRSVNFLFSVTIKLILGNAIQYKTKNLLLAATVCAYVKGITYSVRYLLEMHNRMLIEFETKLNPGHL